MTAAPTTTTGSPKTDLTDLGDLFPCANCGNLLTGPQTSNYLGLGRIEHVWHCSECGMKSHTFARLAGIIEVQALAEDPVTAKD